MLKVKVTQLCPTLCNPWTIEYMEFSRPEYCSGLPFPYPGNLPNPRIKPRSALQVILYQLNHKGSENLLLFRHLSDRLLKHTNCVMLIKSLGDMKLGIQNLKAAEILNVYETTGREYSIFFLRNQ